MILSLFFLFTTHLLSLLLADQITHRTQNENEYKTDGFSVVK